MSCVGLMGLGFAKSLEAAVRSSVLSPVLQRDGVLCFFQRTKETLLASLQMGLDIKDLQQEKA